MTNAKSKLAAVVGGGGIRASATKDPSCSIQRRTIDFFLPFIDGPRNCLGQHLALLEGRVILAYLVKTFKFKTLTDREGEKHSLVVPIAPATHMRMLVE